MRPRVASISAAPALCVALSLLPLPVAALPTDRDQPLQVAADTYVLVGAREDFSTRNGGNIDLFNHVPGGCNICFNCCSACITCG